MRGQILPSVIATFYTTTQQSAWAKNVADALGVPVDTPIAAVA
jgi:hypothetical protein